MAGDHIGTREHFKCEALATRGGKIDGYNRTPDACMSLMINTSAAKQTLLANSRAKATGTTEKFEKDKLRQGATSNTSLDSVQERLQVLRHRRVPRHRRAVRTSIDGQWKIKRL